jgi:hypothetical protein
MFPECNMYNVKPLQMSKFNLYLISPETQNPVKA